MRHIETNLKRVVAVLCAVAMGTGLTACGNSTSTTQPTVQTSLTPMTGVTAEGALGSKPTIKFDSLPYTTHNNQYAILQTGDGDVVAENQNVCLQNLVINTDDGSELDSSWDDDPKDCAVISSSTMGPDYLYFFVGQKVHTTIALSYNLDETSTSTGSTSATGATATNTADRLGGDFADLFGHSLAGSGTADLGDLLRANDITAQTAADETSSSDATSSSSDSSSDSSSATNTHYLWVFTIMSATDVPTHAEGTEVTDLPDGLPTVTRDSSTGKPSIDMSTYDASKVGDDLVTQTLIEGTGDEVAEDQTVIVQYTGWLTDGTQFDSSWDNGKTFTFTFDQVVTGFKGLIGKKVGSQVLLIIPPDQGYGSQATGSIPANSTLIFVVDILSAS